MSSDNVDMRALLTLECNTQHTTHNTRVKFVLFLFWGLEILGEALFRICFTASVAAVDYTVKKTMTKNMTKIKESTTNSIKHF